MAGQSDVISPLQVGRALLMSTRKKFAPSMSHTSRNEVFPIAVLALGITSGFPS